MMKTLLSFVCAMLGFVPVSAQVRLDLEGGVVFGTNYNEVRVPGNTGSLFNANESLKVKPEVFYRVRAGYTFAKRHTISLLYAPLTVRYDGAFDRDIAFVNQTFPRGEAVRFDYQFNSYRITYRYDFVSTQSWQVGAGLTGKIRDADVRLRGKNQDTHFSNVGFVPLVNFFVGYKPSEKWSLILEGDALASKYGRAEDIFAGLSRELNERVGLKLGYRMVEGGADNEKIYNFTWINYASAGLLIRL